MKAISLWQPWATLIMLGAKRIETRSWKPPDALIGERIAIHAAKRIEPCVLLWPFSAFIGDPVHECPTGCLLGSVIIDRAVQVKDKHDVDMVHYPAPGIPGGAEFEQVFGDFTSGRWAWVLREVKLLEKPLPCLGGQRFFNINERGERVRAWTSA